MECANHEYITLFTSRSFCNLSYLSSHENVHITFSKCEEYGQQVFTIWLVRQIISRVTCLVPTTPGQQCHLCNDPIIFTQESLDTSSFTKAGNFNVMQLNSINIPQPINKCLYCFNHCEDLASHDVDNSYFWTGYYVKGFL